MDKYVILCRIYLMKRTSTYDRLQRLEVLTARVKTDEPTTIGEIADELGVSTRTINRDIQVLRDRGLPIDSDRGRGGGIRLHRNWGIGRINLNYAEAVDLLVSLAVAEQMNYPLFMAHLTNVRRKLMASFSPSMVHKVRGLKSRIQIGPSSSIAVLSTFNVADPDIIKHLNQAFLMQQSIQIKYCAQNNEKTMRVIQPHYLLLCYPIWYVLTWDELRNDVRMFRCDRIKAITLKEDSFRLLPVSKFEESLEGVNII